MDTIFGNSAVLFVDDEKSLLKSLQRVFYKEPFKTFFTDSTEEAFKIMEQEEISVLVSDLTMPGIGGLKFLRLVYENHPQIIRIVLTGQSKIPLSLKANNEGPIFKYLVKPWQNDRELIKIVQAGIEHYYWKRNKKQQTDKDNNDNAEPDKKQQEKSDKVATESETDLQRLTKRLVALQSFNKKIVDLLTLDIDAYMKNSAELLCLLRPEDLNSEKAQEARKQIEKINKIIYEIKNIYSRNDN